MRSLHLVILTVPVLISVATGAFAAEIDIPPPAKPKELSVHVINRTARAGPTNA